MSRLPLAPIVDAEAGGFARRRDSAYRRSLALADALATVLALVIALQVAGGTIPLTALLIVPLVVATCKVVGLYDRDEVLIKKTTLDDAPALFQVATLFAFGAWLATGIVVPESIGRGQVLVLWVTLFGGALVLRSTARQAVTRLLRPERMLLLGDARAADRLGDRLRISGIKSELVGAVPLAAREHNVHETVPTLGRLAELEDLVRRHRIERVVIEASAADNEGVLDAVRQAKGLGIKVSLLPRLFEVVGSSVEFDNLNGLTLLGVRRFGLSKSSSLIKRALDVVGSAVGLLAIAPALAAIAVAIKLDTRGPVLFRQTRVGKDGEHFEMMKFRSMVDGAEDRKEELRAHNEAVGLFKLAEDPRITRVGGFLRRTSLDELPQLFNVLRGEMSLVGPRPLVLDEDRTIEGWHRRRLHLMPGMTGHWQIFGSARIPLHEMVNIDYLYVANWSLWQDVKILLRTVPVVLLKRGL